MILNKVKKFFTPAVVTAFILVMIPLQSFAQDADGGGEGVNSGSFGLILQGGIGYGNVIYGNANGKSIDSTLGTGPGRGFDLSAMFNFSILALKIDYNRVELKNLKFTQKVSGANVDYEARGDGYFTTMDALLGLKLFTEAGDMGYTHLYGGYRYWTVERKVTNEYINGAPQNTHYKHDITGAGWIAGYQDLTTIPLGFISFAFQSGLWIDSAPIKTFKANGVKDDINKKMGYGLGLNLGIGAAFEDLGLLVLLGYKTEVTATTYKDNAGVEKINGAGYGLVYLSIAKEF